MCSQHAELNSNRIFPQMFFFVATEEPFSFGNFEPHFSIRIRVSTALHTTLLAWVLFVPSLELELALLAWLAVDNAGLAERGLGTG